MVITVFSYIAVCHILSLSVRLPNVRVVFFRCALFISTIKFRPNFISIFVQVILLVGQCSTKKQFFVCPPLYVKLRHGQSYSRKSVSALVRLELGSEGPMCGSDPIKGRVCVCGGGGPLVVLERGARGAAVSVLFGCVPPLST